MDQDTERYLRRIETKLVRFAEELGVDTDVVLDWISVDDDARVIYLSTLGRSLAVILKEAKKRGASKRNKMYDLIYRGDCVGTIFID